MLRPLPPLICGEYCVLLVGSEWKPRPTPGIVAARFANCRPLSGIDSIRPTSTTPPTAEEVVSISGASPVTVTVSATFATVRPKSTEIVWPTLMTMPFRSIVENPGSSTRML